MNIAHMQDRRKQRRRQDQTGRADNCGDDQQSAADLFIAVKKRQDRRHKQEGHIRHPAEGRLTESMHDGTQNRDKGDCRDDQCIDDRDAAFLLIRKQLREQQRRGAAGPDIDGHELMIRRVIEIDGGNRIRPVGDNRSRGKQTAQIIEIRDKAFIDKHGTAGSDPGVADDAEDLGNDNNPGDQKADQIIPDQDDRMFHHVFQIPVFPVPAPDEIEDREQAGHIEQVVAVQKQEEDHEDKEEGLLFPDIAVNGKVIQRQEGDKARKERIAHDLQ